MGFHGYRPHEADELTSNRRADDGEFHPTRRERSEPRGEPRLCFPGDFSNLWRDAIKLLKFGDADARRKPVGPCAFDQPLANARIAHLGDRATPDSLARRTFFGDQSQIAHHLPRILEPAALADLHHEA